MDLSVVVPAYNEAESLPELAEWIAKVCASSSIDYELIVIDDGSTDDTWEVLKLLTAMNSKVRAIRFRRNYGKAAALQTGFEASAGDVVITMDADLQDSPDEIPGLVRMIREDGYHIVSGWKKKRYDPFIKRSTSRLYNYTARKFSGIRLHDFNCGLKAYDGEVVRSIEVYGEMHRYIPLLAKEAGFRKIGEKIVQHRPRKYGITKYGLDRFLKGYLDMLTISFITRFGKSPDASVRDAGLADVPDRVCHGSIPGNTQAGLCTSGTQGAAGDRQSVFLYRPGSNDNRVFSFSYGVPCRACQQAVT